MDKESFFNDDKDKRIDDERIQSKRSSFFEDGDEDFFKKYSSTPKPEVKADEGFFKSVLSDAQKEDEDESGKADPTFFLKIDRNYAIQEVSKDGLKLKDFSTLYGDDLEIVSLAVGNNADAFAYASKKLQSNKLFVDLLISSKQLDIEEVKSKDSNNYALIAILEQQIQSIIDIHEKAIKQTENGKNYNNFHGISM